MTKACKPPESPQQAPRKLAEIEHTQPEGTLPAGFAERFSLHDTGGGVMSMSDIERAIQRLQKKLSRLQGMRAEQQQKQADALQLKQDAELTVKKERLADAQKKATDAATDAAKGLAELEAELGK